MKTDRSIEGIYKLPNGDIFVLAWNSALIPRENFGGVELVPASELASPYLGTNGDNKWWIFSPHLLIKMSNAPSEEEVTNAEKLQKVTVH